MLIAKYSRLLVFFPISNDVQREIKMCQNNQNPNMSGANSYTRKKIQNKRIGK